MRRSESRCRRSPRFPVLPTSVAACPRRHGVPDIFSPASYSLMAVSSQSLLRQKERLTTSGSPTAWFADRLRIACALERNCSCRADGAAQKETKAGWGTTPEEADSKIPWDPGRGCLLFEARHSEIAAAKGFRPSP